MECSRRLKIQSRIYCAVNLFSTRPRLFDGIDRGQDGSSHRSISFPRVGRQRDDGVTHAQRKELRRARRISDPFVRRPSLPASSHLQRVNVAFDKVRVLSRPAVHLQTRRSDVGEARRQMPMQMTRPWGEKKQQPSANLDLGTEAVEEGLAGAVTVLADSEGMSGERSEDLPGQQISQMCLGRLID